MEYSKIIAVTGLPGLHELISSKTDGAIVRSLDDKSTKFVSSRIHNFSHLESIEVYTVRENVNLIDVFNAMDSGGHALPDEKDAKAIKSYFETVYPDIDFERVYNSDMKKMIKWYTTLKSNNVELKLSEPEPEEAAVEVAEEVEEEETEKTKKKATAKKSEAPQVEKPETSPRKKSASVKEKKEVRAAKEKKTAPKSEATPKKKAAEKGKEDAGKKEPKKKTPPKKK